MGLGTRLVQVLLCIFNHSEDSLQMTFSLLLIQHVVFAIAGTFLYHVDHFRRYSTFCASHYKVKVILGKIQQRLIGWTKSHLELFHVLQDCNGSYNYSYTSFLFCLARQDNTQLQQFLEARNPKKDGTLNLDALLAKPIVVRFNSALFT